MYKKVKRVTIQVPRKPRGLRGMQNSASELGILPPILTFEESQAKRKEFNEEIVALLTKLVESDFTECAQSDFHET